MKGEMDSGSGCEEGALTESQRRHVLATLRHIDRLLRETEVLLAGVGRDSPLWEYAGDIDPAARRVIEEGVRRTREALGKALERLGMLDPPPVGGALWAARGRVAFARIALAELEPRRMRGYGELSETQRRLLEEATRRIGETLDELARRVERARKGAS